jgi:sigma-B regulation protein RsbU (phosphoserine phosphatase)
MLDGDAVATVSVTIDQDAHTFVVTVFGELDAATAGTLESALEAVDPSEGAGVMVDLEHVDFIDSAGLKTLMICQRRLAARGIGLAVSNPQPQARRLFQISLGEHPFNPVPAQTVPA